MALAVAFVLPLAACSGGDGEPPPTPPEVATEATLTPAPFRASTASPSPALPDPSPEPRPTATLAGMYPPGTRTGDPAIDAILAAFEQKDLAAIESRIRYKVLPCASEQRRDRPLCPEGVAPGTTIKALSIGHCEGGLRPRDRVPLALERQLTGTLYLYGIARFRSPSGETETLVMFGVGPKDDAGVLFPLDADGRLTRVQWSCGIWPVPFQGVTWVLPPRG